MKEKYTFCDIDPKVVGAWRDELADIQNVEIKEGDIFTEYWQWDTPVDALVCPGNSFGLMDGGFDEKAYGHYQGGEIDIQFRVRKKIKENWPSWKGWDAMLPVGNAEVVEAEKKTIPYVIYAPTMQSARPICEEGNTNVYRAMKAVIYAAQKHNSVSPDKIKHIVVPGLGTGVGILPPDRSAKQIRNAFQKAELLTRQ